MRSALYSRLQLTRVYTLYQLSPLALLIVFFPVDKSLPSSLSIQTLPILQGQHKPSSSAKPLQNVLHILVLALILFYVGQFGFTLYSSNSSRTEAPLNPLQVLP